MYKHLGIDDWLFVALYGGSLFREYLSQVLSVGIIAFVLWRTEGLQALSTDGEIEDDGREDKGSALRAEISQIDTN